jgi:O-antigen/teichoic acid export membrane protein
LDTRSSDNTSLRTQGAWLVGAKVLAFGFSFALPLLVVRFLDQTEVGHYRQAFQVITNAVVILPLGFSMSAYYYLSREVERRGQAILNILLFNFFAGGLACLILYLYPHLLGSVFRSEELTPLAPKIGLVIWIWIFSTFLETVALANSEARVATAFIILASFSKTVLMSTAVIVFGTVEAFIYAALLQGVIQAFILLAYLRSRFPGFWRGFDKGFFIEQMFYALPYGVAGVLWIAQTDIHNYFVGYKVSPSEFAVYAYGCFEVPLIAMLTESVTSVLIPRMTALQLNDKKDEMIRLTARVAEKLSLVLFPVYVFLMITAFTFITTLFTTKFEASVPIFMINLTLLPTSILVNDPVVRSFKDLGRPFLVARVVILTLLVAVLYLGLDRLSMVGMISVAVTAILTERVIAGTFVFRKLGIGFRHLTLFKNVGKTALAAGVAGFITYLFYTAFSGALYPQGQELAAAVFRTGNPTILNFVGGCLVLGASALLFTPLYVFTANLLGLFEDDEKRSVHEAWRRLWPGRLEQQLGDTQ